MSIIPELIREDLSEFKAYSSAYDEAKEALIRLNANESPWQDDADTSQPMNRYPQKQPPVLLDQLSRLYGVMPEQVAMLRGSDEAIDLLIRLFCRAGRDAILICPPTFGYYAVCAQLQGAAVVEVPLDISNGFQLHLDQIFSTWRPEIKIIFLCSPNNPTGNALLESDVLKICEHFAGKSLVVVDEAYIEFSGAQSLSRFLSDYPNLAILRTFSKAYGLAGARFGTLLAQADLIQWINKIMPPYPLPTPTIETVLKALTPQAMALRHIQIQTICQQRDFMKNHLSAIPIIKQIYPSEANFLLAECVDAEKIFIGCAQQGIILRDLSHKPYLSDCIRITIGTERENSRVIEMINHLAN